MWLIVRRMRVRMVDVGGVAMWWREWSSRIWGSATCRWIWGIAWRICTCAVIVRRIIGKRIIGSIELRKVHVGGECVVERHRRTSALTLLCL
jgi:hypothetical protein